MHRYMVACNQQVAEHPAPAAYVMIPASVVAFIDDAGRPDQRDDQLVSSSRRRRFLAID